MFPSPKKEKKAFTKFYFILFYFMVLTKIYSSAGGNNVILSLHKNPFLFVGGSTRLLLQPYHILRLNPIISSNTIWKEISASGLPFSFKREDITLCNNLASKFYCIVCLYATKTKVGLPSSNNFNRNTFRELVYDKFSLRGSNFIRKWN